MDFILGFTQRKLVLDNIVFPCVEFVRQCFLWKKPPPPQFKGKHGSPAALARIRAFAGDEISNAHTGVVLLETGVPGTEFRMGAVSVAPYGLPFPECPCGAPASLQSSERKNSVQFKCCICQKFKKDVKKPVDIMHLEAPEISPYHFLLPFPYVTPELAYGFPSKVAIRETQI